MAEEITTNQAPGATQGGYGRIVRIVGPVVDVEFAPTDMPAIYNALVVDADTAIGHVHTILEVQSHLGGDMVRCVAMTSTDGMTRGIKVLDTGSPMRMPVGPQTLGRIWNVIGEPVDGGEMPDDVEFYPIHRVLFGTDAGGFIRTLSGKDTGELVTEADAFCRDYIAAHGGTVDYIHGEEEARRMGSQPGCAALILPTLPKEELFPHIQAAGNYPKKSFSVGHSLDKRWYLECRRITEE